jgi:hypothetical protein
LIALKNPLILRIALTQHQGEIVNSKSPPPVHPKILELCNQVRDKRPRTVINHIIQHGHVTTEELQDLYGYSHPPRGAMDVRDNGIPLKTFRVTSQKDGRSIGAYRFGDPEDIKNGRIGGRQVFSQRFKKALIERYDSRCTTTGEKMHPRYLQIDHRIPYEVAGDKGLADEDIEAYMLLDASAQRQKSWSCEHCGNWTDIQDIDTCKTCFWASPEAYMHVAMAPRRRLDISWEGYEVEQYDSLKAKAEVSGMTIQDYVKRLLGACL